MLQGEARWNIMGRKWSIIKNKINFYNLKWRRCHSAKKRGPRTPPSTPPLLHRVKRRLF